MLRAHSLPRGRRRQSARLADKLLCRDIKPLCHECPLPGEEQEVGRRECGMRFGQQQLRRLV